MNTTVTIVVDSPSGAAQVSSDLGAAGEALPAPGPDDLSATSIEPSDAQGEGPAPSLGPDSAPGGSAVVAAATAAQDAPPPVPELGQSEVATVDRAGAVDLAGPPPDPDLVGSDSDAAEDSAPEPVPFEELG